MEFITGLKNYLNSFMQAVEDFLAKLNLTPMDIVRFVSCLGVGFLIGMFLRHYAKYFVIIVISSMLLLAVLNYGNIIVINHEHIKMLLGFSHTETFESMMNSVLMSIRIHAIEIGCVILGSLLGFKLG